MLPKIILQTAWLSGVLIFTNISHPVNAMLIQKPPVETQTESPLEASAELKPVIIDVRSKAEFIFGHHPDAHHLEYSTISDTIGRLQLNKDTPIVLYCRSGRRASLAKSDLEKLGYSNVVNGINLATMEQQ